MVKVCLLGGRPGWVAVRSLCACVLMCRPLLQLPGPDKPTVVVKCCPVPFALKKTSECSITRYVEHNTMKGVLVSVCPSPSLPYRLVYAVASLDSILFYDTQHLAPFAHVSNIHYSGITDLAWYVCIVCKDY